MSEFKELDWFALKKECAKRGFSSKGKKQELLARLEEKPKEIPLPNQPEKDMEAALPSGDDSLLHKIIPPTSSELAAFLPNKSYAPAPVVTQEKAQPWICDKELQTLHNMLSPIAAGKGKFEFILEPEKGAYQVVFSGNAGRIESTTLIDTHNKIVEVARSYFRLRVVRGSSGQTAYM